VKIVCNQLQVSSQLENPSTMNHLSPPPSHSDSHSHLKYECARKFNQMQGKAVLVGGLLLRTSSVNKLLYTLYGFSTTCNILQLKKKKQLHLPATSG